MSNKQNDEYFEAIEDGHIIKTVKIKCPDCKDKSCVECENLGFLEVCPVCLGTGSTLKRIAIDDYVSIRCDDLPSCGRLYKHNSEDLEEITK